MRPQTVEQKQAGFEVSVEDCSEYIAGSYNPKCLFGKRGKIAQPVLVKLSFQHSGIR